MLRPNRFPVLWWFIFLVITGIDFYDTRSQRARYFYQAAIPQQLGIASRLKGISLLWFGMIRKARLFVSTEFLGF